MYLLSLFVFMVLCTGFMAVSVGGGLQAITYLIDMPSIILIILILVPMLLSAGLLKDLNNAFRLGVRRNVHAGKTELTRAVEAVSFTVKALWSAGIFSMILQFIIAIVNAKPSIEMAFIYTAISLLPLCYVSFFVILLLPLKSRLDMRLKMDCEENINIHNGKSKHTEQEHEEGVISATGNKRVD